MESETIKVLAIHPAGYSCPLEGNSLLYFWNNKDWQSLELPIVALTKIMLDMVGEKRCNYGCGACYKAYKDWSCLILKNEPTPYNFNSYYHMVKSD